MDGRRGSVPYSTSGPKFEIRAISSRKGQGPTEIAPCIDVSPMTYPRNIPGFNC